MVLPRDPTELLCRILQHQGCSNFKILAKVGVDDEFQDSFISSLINHHREWICAEQLVSSMSVVFRGDDEFNERGDTSGVQVLEKCESHENPCKVSRKLPTESKKWENAVDRRRAYIGESATEITNVWEENLGCRFEGLEKNRKEKEPVSVEESSEKKIDELIRSTKKPVTDEKFLKFLNEYSVIDHPNRIQAGISLLSLVSCSEPHREALMKWLSEYHVSHDILVKDLSGILGNITASNSLTFTDKEIPPEGKGHNKALYIEVFCNGRLLTDVLVDNGSSMNIMTKTAFEKLKCDEKHIKTNSIVGVGFDGSKKESLGEIELPIVIKSCVFKVKFQVMEVNSTYSCLLGRPWIHSAGVVPSSLHQSLKFMVDGELKVIHGVVPKPSSISYIKAAAAFQSLNWFLNLGLSHTSKLLELFNLW